MPGHLARIVLLANLLGTLVSSAEAKVKATFTYPREEGLKFFQDDTVNVSWESNIRNASLWLCCNINNEVKIGERRLLLSRISV